MARSLSAFCAVVLVLPAQQAAPPAGLTIGQAVEGALKNYPSVRVSQEQINAAAAGIQLARTAYLPRIDLLAQANRVEHATSLFPGKCLRCAEVSTSFPCG